jgi:hypothetical protein
MQILDGLNGKRDTLRSDDAGLRGDQLLVHCHYRQYCSVHMGCSQNENSQVAYPVALPISVVKARVFDLAE